MYNDAVKTIFEKIESAYSEIENEVADYGQICQNKFKESGENKGYCEEFVRILNFTKDIHWFKIEKISPYNTGEKRAKFNQILRKIDEFYISVEAYANRYFDDVYCSGLKEESGFIYDVKNIIDKHLERIKPEIIIFPNDEIKDDEQNKKFIEIYKLYEKMSTEIILFDNGLIDDIRTVMGKVFKYIWKLNGDKKVDITKLTNKWNNEIEILYKKRFPKEDLKVKKVLKTYNKEIEKIVS
ncbi:MAG: hypothetical protein GX926_03215 [Candidatus Magasanikbacteria bacterium]|nr:hypothetical protein [Candidatus Magasanikbacteria bacterium]